MSNVRNVPTSDSGGGVEPWVIGDGVAPQISAICRTYVNIVTGVWRTREVGQVAKEWLGRPAPMNGSATRPERSLSGGEFSELCPQDGDGVGGEVRGGLWVRGQNSCHTPGGAWLPRSWVVRRSSVSEAAIGPRLPASTG